MYQTISSWFLAASMFMFGVLKFINPFKAWYAVQITNSGLGNMAYAMGILGETATGILLLLCLLYKRRLQTKTFQLLTTFAYSSIVVIMVTGVYVHLHPAVPAAVLPLKIKPPYIPVFLFVLACLNLVVTVLAQRKAKQTSVG